MSDPITIWGLFLLMVPLMQLWARIFWMNGSMDKPWLLIPIFFVPPFSLVPAFMMYFGYVADGQGVTPPYDWWMLVPIIVKFCIGLLVSSLVAEPGFFSAFIPLIIQLCVNVIPHYYRSVENCGATFDHIGKAFLDGAIENGIGDIAPTILKFIPFIGAFFRLLSRLPLIGPLMDKLIWIIMYTGSYVVINMMNESADIAAFCAEGFLGTTKDIIAGLIFLIISIGYCFFEGGGNVLSNVEGSAINYATDYLPEGAQNYASGYGYNY